jgi:putative ABC transport system permease protein
MKLPDMLEYIAVGFKADRFKTLMSSLGIIIGVMAIVVMLSVVEGLYSGVSSQFSALNLDVIRVIPGTFNFGLGAQPSFRTPQEPAKFTDKDTKALENIVGIKTVAPETSANVVIRFRDKNASASLTGVDPKKEIDLNSKIALGRFLTDSDYKSVVIGSGISNGLFRMEHHSRKQDTAVLSGPLHGLQGGRSPPGAAADVLWWSRQQPKYLDVHNSQGHEGTPE